MTKTVKAAINIISNSIGDWWKDDRRQWCAYCGITMKLSCTPGEIIPANKATRDHVIPKKIAKVGLTIPACRTCNQEKGALSLPEFMGSDYFTKIRKRKHKNKWSDKDLWKVQGLAALKKSI